MCEYLNIWLHEGSERMQRLVLHKSEGFTALFTKPPDGLPPYRMASRDCSVRQLSIDIFPFCRERPVTKELAAL